MSIDVRDHIPAEIFDYQTLVDALRGLAFPRNKIHDLLRQGIIIRVKKGLYIFGDKRRKHPYSRELLANLVYGPSYISLDYALAYHGLIPERVEALTSVTINRSRRFATPVGLFTYKQIPALAYGDGMLRVEGEHQQAFLIASPEKALADKIVAVRGGRIASIAEMGRFLEQDLRIDPGSLRPLSAEKIDGFASSYRSSKLKHLGGWIRRARESAEGRGHE